MVRLKYFRPIVLPGMSKEQIEKYAMYPMCFGCMKPLRGWGLAFNITFCHILCLFKLIRNEREWNDWCKTMEIDEYGHSKQKGV